MTHYNQLTLQVLILIASPLIIPFPGGKESVPSQEMTSLLYHLNLILSSFHLSRVQQAAMEDWNMIAADCVVISCCCQCLVLQIVVFILLELPYKLIRKTKQYVKRKLGKPKREGNVMERERNGYYTDVGHSGSFRIEEFCMEEWRGYGNSIEEVEKVLEDMSRKGEFSFGSFWSGEDLEESFPMYLVKQLERQNLQYKLVTYSIAY